jgi:hypothetical protein
MVRRRVAVHVRSRCSRVPGAHRDSPRRHRPGCPLCQNHEQLTRQRMASLWISTAMSRRTLRVMIFESSPGTVLIKRSVRPWWVRVAPGVSSRGSHRTVRKPLGLYGSCRSGHQTALTVFTQVLWVPIISSPQVRLRAGPRAGCRRVGRVFARPGHR